MNTTVRVESRCCLQEGAPSLKYTLCNHVRGQKIHVRGSAHAGGPCVLPLSPGFCPTLGWFIPWGVAVVLHEQTIVLNLHASHVFPFSREMLCMEFKHLHKSLFLCNKSRIVKVLKRWLMAKPQIRFLERLCVHYNVINFHWIKCRSKSSLQHMWHCCVHLFTAVMQSVADIRMRGWRDESKHWNIAAAHRDQQRRRKLFYYP